MNGINEKPKLYLRLFIHLYSLGVVYQTAGIDLLMLLGVDIESLVYVCCLRQEQNIDLYLFCIKVFYNTCILLLLNILL